METFVIVVSVIVFLVLPVCFVSAIITFMDNMDEYNDG